MVTVAAPLPGDMSHLGAKVTTSGVNFCVYSKYATAVELLFFEQEDSSQPSHSFCLDPRRHRTYHYWHAWVDGVRPGQLYGYLVHGPWAPERGLRFDCRNLLLDPYGLAVATPPGYGRRPGRSGADEGFATSMKSVVVDPSLYDWEGDRPLRRPRRETVIYELHVRGFTRHPSSGVAPERAGTYAGLIEKIPYLQELGITAVELLPVFAFDRLDAPAGKVNYWGYAPISLFAPHAAYSSRSDHLGALDEFRDLVKALHRAGLEVILDVVFNHTAEGDERGPSFCFRGLANEAYYILEADRSRYANFSGTGNTLNANHPMVRRMVRHSLRYWVQHMHVDGFRFDLASVLARDEQGHPMPLPPLLWDIETDPALAGTKLIAEAWDAAGLYQVGNFIGDSWQEWNGHFRDDVRHFLKSDPAMVPRAALRALGSPDIYGHEEREAEQSVNFITCHDGFTLADLVSYNTKHNQDNGEDNRDGSNDNASWNCGVEGPSGDTDVLALRHRQMRNFLVFLLISIGTPMLSMGDEVARTQGGNNNPYCQDNEISWFDWTLCQHNNDLLRFVRLLIAQRKSRAPGQADHELPSLNELLQRRQIEWHGVTLHQPDWGLDSRSFAITVTGEEIGFRLHLMANAWWEPLDFELPAANGVGSHWRRWVDTALFPPDDIAEGWLAGPAVTSPRYRVGARSLVVLLVQLS
jgi:glycogen operon protein